MKKYLNCILVLGIFLFSGCSTWYQSLHKTSGKVIVGYTENTVVPYTTSLKDLAAACQTAQSMSAFLLSYETLGVDVRRTKILLSMLAGHCMTEQVWEAELEYLRAVNQKNSLAAKDANIRQSRYAELAAQRYWQGYQAWQAYFLEGASLENSCPKTFSEEDQLYWLVGLLNGLMALFHDGQADRSLLIPLSVAKEVQMRAPCIEDAKWWGMASALAALVDALQLTPSADWPLKLEQAIQMGVEQGVRLPSAFAANLYLLKGDQEQLKTLIRAFYQRGEATHFAVNPQWYMFDRSAEAYIQAMSDVLWTEQTGHRTPFGQQGTFWDDEDDADTDLDWDW